MSNLGLKFQTIDLTKTKVLLNLVLKKFCDIEIQMAEPETILTTVSAAFWNDEFWLPPNVSWKDIEVRQSDQIW